MSSFFHWSHLWGIQSKVFFGPIVLWWKHSFSTRPSIIWTQPSFRNPFLPMPEHSVTRKWDLKREDPDSKGDMPEVAAVSSENEEVTWHPSSLQLSWFYSTLWVEFGQRSLCGKSKPLALTVLLEVIFSCLSWQSWCWSSFCLPFLGTSVTWKYRPSSLQGLVLSLLTLLPQELWAPDSEDFGLR